ncbi:MAG: VWA domain-containing protein [Candidatus Pacebacteria bacterium]|nr:VWA domain-containing protein [Candidatus Paceibacterota bacterium]
MKTNFNKLILLLSFLLIFFAFNFSSAEDSLVSDAIAIRVLPNPNHYGIETWYRMQGFSGSPQSLIVDGYEAIRDGRTVYVAAANILDKLDPSKDIIYTNIYLISYNQESNNSTMDVLGQIISHWKFNYNINNDPGKCSLSTLVCREDSDCPAGFVCGNEGVVGLEFQNNKCVIEESDANLPNTKNCLIDSDCTKGFFCSSVKARITRDVIRVGRLTDFTAYLERYKNQFGVYPVLSAGSYIQNTTFSTWPSWNNVLGSALGFSSKMIDPINIFGPCIDETGVYNYNLDTCWDEEKLKFYDNDLSNEINLPLNSFVYAYRSENYGSEYNLCATLETASKFEFDDTEGISISNANCEGMVGYGLSFVKDPITIKSYNLNGQSQLPFNGVIEINNPDGRILSNWNINLTETDFTNEGWTDPDPDPILKLVPTNNPNKRLIQNPKAGAVGQYIFNFSVADNLPSTDDLEETLTITIGDESPQIQAQNIDYYYDGVTPLDYNVYLFDNNFNNLTNTNNWNLIVNYPTGFTPNIGNASVGDLNIGNGLTVGMVYVASNQYRLNINGLLDSADVQAALSDPEPDTISFTLNVEDASGNSANKTFLINIINGNPIFNFNCPDEIRAGEEKFECFITLEDPEEVADIAFSTEYLSGTNYVPYTLNPPKNLPLNFNFNSSSSFLSGFLDYNTHFGEPPNYQVSSLDDYAKFKITVEAINTSGVSSESSFEFRANSFCGDGYFNFPNGELAGGPFGDGYEECDGLAETACDGGCDPQVSYEEKKPYACTTNSSTSKPVQAGTCTYTGGMCGDSLLQDDYMEECDFGVNNNCCNFCKWDFQYPETTTPVYFTTQEGSLDYQENITLAWQGGPGETAYISMPEAVSFKPDSVFIDILTEVELTIEPTSIVFITDVSGSMNERIDDVRQSLIGTTDVDVNEALPGSVMHDLKQIADESNNIRVGLVDFGDVVNSDDIIDLHNNGDYSNLVNIISFYDDIGSATETKNALMAAHEMLSAENDDPFKFYILLSDGNPTGDDPWAYVKNTIRTSTSYINDEAFVYSIYFSDDPKNNLLQRMCFWSNDDIPYDCAGCDITSGCVGANYTFLSTTGVSSAYDNIVEDISREPSDNELEIEINGELLDPILLEEGESNYLNQQIFLNNVSCDPESAQCSPSYVPFTASFTNGNGTINFSNLRMQILESCQAE